jgi:hypothetical protein
LYKNDKFFSIAGEYVYEGSYGGAAEYRKVQDNQKAARHAKKAPFKGQAFAISVCMVLWGGWRCGGGLNCEGG